MVDFSSFVLPDGWKRWRHWSNTVVSSEIGVVVTGVADMEIVLLGAIMDTDATSKVITIAASGGDTITLDVSDEQRWLAPSAEGPYFADGETLTVKIGVGSAGSGSAGSYVTAWGFLRPIAAGTNGDVYTGTADLS